MSIRMYVGRGLVAAAVITGTTFGTSVAAHAADPTISVQAGRLVLEPGARGYHGSLPVTVTYNGDAPNYASVKIVEPVAGSFRTEEPSEACVFGGLEGIREIDYCGVPGGDLQPGEKRKFTLEFEVLTASRSYAMSAASTTVQALLGNDATPSNVATSQTLFRGTNGSIRNPRPYVQDTDSNIKVTAQDATLTQQEDGSYAGRITVTAKYAGDAPHYNLGVDVALPAGVEFDGIEPSEPCGGLGCMVPGGQFMAGETRTFQLLVSVPPGTPAGVLGSASAKVHANWHSDIADVDPSDNTATVTLTVG